MIRAFGGCPNPGGFNVLICTSLDDLTNDHPVCDDYRDDKGNVISTGLPVAETSIAYDVTLANKKILLNGIWN